MSKTIKLNDKEIERLENVLESDIWEWEDSGDRYAKDREIKLDKNILQKLKEAVE